MSGRKVLFVHCSDLHLDSPFSGLSDISPSLGGKLRKATFQAFQNAVTYAIRKSADFFTVSGDVFDGEDRSIRAQLFFTEQIKRLSDAGIPVFIARGNHDPISGWEAEIDLPPLAARFGGEVESRTLLLDGETSVTVHGCSFPVRDVTDNLALRFGGRRKEGVNVALLHCNVGGRPGHENYAPCSLDDLKRAGMDCWALGHVHGAEILSLDPLVLYPGNIQGRNARETGTKGVYAVTVLPPSGALPARCSSEFIPCDAIRWRKEKIAIEGMSREGDFIRAVEELRESVRDEMSGTPAILQIVLSGRGKMHGVLRRPGFLFGPGSLLESLNAGEEEREDFVLLQGFSGLTSPALDAAALSRGDHLVGDFLKEILAFEARGSLVPGLLEILDGMGIMDKFVHREVLSRIESLSDADAASIVDNAASLALDGLIRGDDCP